MGPPGREGSPGKDVSVGSYGARLACGGCRENGQGASLWGPEVGACGGWRRRMLRTAPGVSHLLAPGVPVGVLRRLWGLVSSLATWDLCCPAAKEVLLNGSLVSVSIRGGILGPASRGLASQSLPD